MSRKGPRPVSERLRRLLVMLPWLMERGTVSTAEMADHFGTSVDELIADLTLASLCGVSQDPRDLIDLWVDEDQVHFGLPKYFERPLRLTPPEAFSLVVSTKAALALPGADPGGALARAVAKIGAVIGSDRTDVVDVELVVPDEVEPLRRAVAAAEIVEFEYWSPTSGRTSSRSAVPLEVFAEGPHWYLRAFDRAAAAERTFRIDRVESLVATGRSEPHPVGPRRPWFADAEDATTVTLWVEAGWTWVLENYPLVSTTPVDGGVRVSLVVTSDRWLERVLLRLGTHAIVEQPTEHAARASSTAVRVLSRYERR